MKGGCTRRDMLLGAVGLGGLLCGCSPGEQTADREFLIVEASHPTKREPTSAGKFYALMGIAETLVNVDDRGHISTGLALHWEMSADGLEWRFDLRPGAHFHDGTPVTAEPVVRMLERARKRPGVMHVVPIAAIAAHEGRVIIRLATPSALLLPVLAHDSTIILAPASFDAADQAVQVIGSGPYRITGITEQEVAVEAWERWGGVPPAIHRARYLSAARPETRALLSESGQANAVFDLDWPSERRLRDAGHVHIVDIASPRTTLLKLNVGHPFLADLRARQALSLAVDRLAIATGLFGNADRAATQLLPEFFTDWHDKNLPRLHTDVAQAQRLLAELGWQPGADGILLRGDERFALKLLSLATRTDQPLITAALQQQFRRIGVEISVIPCSPAEIVAAHRDGTLELAMFARNHMMVANPVAVLMQDYAKGGADWGAMGWNNPDMIAALQTLASGAAPERAAALRQQIVQTLQAELPVIPLIFNRRIAAFDKRLANVQVDALERSYNMAAMRWAD
ncbi:ABC transporter substrate-binding protein [Niveispirillum sp. SYP-B3756]|uniref:ABC transporter substrate-binding protein n=1 Tax=Niveispirillum sp. SYP-B3756 TaxID=2662178 RepID=UPI0012926E0D|nr:ABC transporter substrate-binding protein [Niveispirillum sp. SYP-B3756]MQP67054.1 ABC transporter substrate-binding protein [Niveispirillum sp. SYP-B3756]